MLPHPSSSQVTTSIAPPSTTASVPITTTTNTTNTSASTSTPTPTATPTPTSTPTPTPASIATPAPSSAAPTGGAVLKRPAASDLQRIAGTSATPSVKRQATASGNYNVRSNPTPNPSSFESPAPSHPRQVPQPQRLQQQQQHLYLQQHPTPAMMPAAPALITEDQLHGRTPEELIATILRLQSQQQQFVAQINAQYEHISQQLQDLRGSLIASHQAAASVRN